MQFLLTQEEYASLAPLERIERRDKALAWARDSILAAHGKKCVKETGGYCSFCPISDIGGKAGEQRPDRDTSKLLCDNYRNYPK